MIQYRVKNQGTPTSPETNGMVKKLSKVSECVLLEHYRDAVTKTELRTRLKAIKSWFMAFCLIVLMLSGKLLLPFRNQVLHSFLKVPSRFLYSLSSGASPLEPSPSIVPIKNQRPEKSGSFVAVQTSPMKPLKISPKIEPGTLQQSCCMPNGVHQGGNCQL